MKLSDVSVTVAPDVTILGPISLELGPDEWTAVVGPNGAGKTTLCHVAAGALSPSAGSVSIASQVGLLAQSPPRPIGLTTLEYALLGAAGWGGESESVVARARESLGLCGIDPGRRVETLSGGEFRKAGVARLMTLDAQVLVLDEPTAGLDPQSRIEIFELLDKIRAGRTLLTVMHDLTTAAQFAERFVVMRRGRIVCDGPPGEVMTEDSFLDTFGGAVRLVVVDGRTVPVMIR